MTRTLLGVLLGAAVLVVLVSAPLTRRDGNRPLRHAVSPSSPPFAAGDAAGNIALREGGDRILLRWVARRTGRVRALYVRVKFAGAGYGRGTGGVLEATTHPVLPDGRPRVAIVLAVSRLAPARSVHGGSLALPLGIDVEAGQELATVIRNAAFDPARDYFSVNFLFERQGLVGANGRNERRATACDAAYGLDPRELVGYSRDGGRRWRLPGGPYGARSGKSFLPTYVQEYVDGRASGQVYYYARPISGSVTMVYRNGPRPWTINRVAAYSRGGTAEVAVEVDGRREATGDLGGRGFVSGPIDPLEVPPGGLVRLTLEAGAEGLRLDQLFADAVWARLARLGRGNPWYLESDPQTAVPLYALPAAPSSSTRVLRSSGSAASASSRSSCS